MIPTEAPFRTHPYRPPIRTTSPDDAPLVVKGTDELPARLEGLIYVTYSGEKAQARLTGRYCSRCARASKEPLSKDHVSGLQKPRH